MKTRKEKWQRYREKILATPADKFPPVSEVSLRPQTHADKEEIQNSVVSSSLVIERSTKQKRVTPYAQWVKRQRLLLGFKLFLLLLAVVLLILLYLFWVRG